MIIVNPVDVPASADAVQSAEFETTLVDENLR